MLLATTLTQLHTEMADVGKSIGGNRYVAGAAALAALGLTFSKLFAVSMN